MVNNSLKILKFTSKIEVGRWETIVESTTKV